MLAYNQQTLVQNAEVVHFLLSHADSLTDLNEQHQPVGRRDENFTLTLAPNFYPHRDEAIDLCAIDVTVPVGNLMASGRKVRSLILDASWLPDEVDRANMRTVEPVIVVGYPRGLFDAHNNMPIVRRGGTATHPLAHYQNRRDFLVDVAAYGGSSGSPVFRFESPFYRDANGTLSPGTKGQFLGVVWGVIETTSQGVLHVVEIPSGQSQIPLMQTSLNLAIALHGDLIRDFDDQIFPSGASCTGCVLAGRARLVNPVASADPCWRRGHGCPWGGLLLSSPTSEKRGNVKRYGAGVLGDQPALIAAYQREPTTVLNGG